MKLLKIFIQLAVLVVILTQCKKIDPEIEFTPQQLATRQLTGTWGNAVVVSSPVADAHGTLNNLTITFDSSIENILPAGFSASGAPEYFLTNTESAWMWESINTSTEILLVNVSPVQELTIDDLTGASLTITFTFESEAGGRIAGIGEYQVKLSRIE